MSALARLVPQTSGSPAFYNQASHYFLSSQLHGTGLVVVRDSRVLGLHCSGSELHAGQVAIVSHGPDLANCQLYFSRRPCATCLKMLINGEATRFFLSLLPLVARLLNRGVCTSGSAYCILPLKLALLSTCLVSF